MREIIKNVAGVISDLQTLNLLGKRDVTTTIDIDEQTKKYILTVRVIASEIILPLCLDMFQKLRDYGYKMNIEENDCISLTINFYE